LSYLVVRGSYRKPRKRSVRYLVPVTGTVAIFATLLCLPSFSHAQSSPATATAADALQAAKTGPKAERRSLFLAVANQWKGTQEGAEARWRVAYFDLIAKDFDASLTRFREVARDPNADPAIAGEALLQTGFLPISAFWASKGTEADKLKLLQEAFSRLSQIAKSGGSGTVAGTTRSYAASGCAEVFLLQGNPVQAEQWYRQALTNTEAEPTATTMATYGLGVALYRQGRYGEALQAQTLVSTQGKTGIMLRALLVSPSLPAKASLWRAAALSHLGQKKAAIVAIDDALRLRNTIDPNSHMLAQAENAKAALQTQVQIAMEREELLQKAKELAADTNESPLKSTVSTVSEVSDVTEVSRVSGASGARVPSGKGVAR
jgi:tetratricopeptide (TPR) repeat protein